MKQGQLNISTSKGDVSSIFDYAVIMGRWSGNYRFVSGNLIR
jgi:hypothetical protein